MRTGQEREMREKIIDTAIEEFTRNGLKFTMNDVAKALGISKKTIYTVFESKQDVLMAIADRYARDFTDMRQEIEADTELDTLEKLERLFCAIPTKYYNIGLSRIFELAQKYPKQSVRGGHLPSSIWRKGSGKERSGRISRNRSLWR